ncbi:hypothetical protein BDV97DRAFT_345768 [Delphinella strobiligena]|nr:hypothetical protein BDV97DRAFT_345768 [Delphinella strobiligena]
MRCCCPSVINLITPLEPRANQLTDEIIRYDFIHTHHPTFLLAGVTKKSPEDRRNVT